VILEADQGCRFQVGHVGVDDDVANESFFAGLSANVDQSDAREALAIGGLVVVAEKLIAATHREDDCARFDRSFEWWLLVL